MRPDWYPDPSGRHEFRYFNGQTWTADVSDDGERFVDPFDGGSPADGDGPGNGVAVAALTCGIVSVAFGWLPVLFVVGAVLAVLAIVFGVVGRRRARDLGRGRGMAIAGLCTGVAGVLVAVGGLVFTIAMFRALERYENPEPNTVAVTMCVVVDGAARVAGTLRNDSERRADFTVLVEVDRAGSGVRLTSSRQQIDRVAPGATVDWAFSRAVAVDDIECGDPQVTGPLPFGVVPR